MVEFDDLNDLHQSIDEMIHRDNPLVVLIPKGSGRREDRFTHTLSGDIDVSALEKDTVITSLPELDNDKLEAIEARLAVIEKKLGITLEL